MDLPGTFLKLVLGMTMFRLRWEKGPQTLNVPESTSHSVETHSGTPISELVSFCH